jgi:hypothetical protein
MCFYTAFVHIYNILRHCRPLFDIMNLSVYNLPSNSCAKYTHFSFTVPVSKYLLSNAAISTLGMIYSTGHTCKDCSPYIYKKPTLSHDL